VVVWLTMLPNYFTCSVVICHMNTYVLLLLRLQLFIDERDGEVGKERIARKNVFILEKVS
jgi:hypothetical protein